MPVPPVRRRLILLQLKRLLAAVRNTLVRGARLDRTGWAFPTFLVSMIMLRFDYT